MSSNPMLRRLLALMGKDAPATIEFIGFFSNTADQTTYTFTNHSIGGPGLIVVIAGADAGSARDIVSATIGGTAATEVRLENGLANQCSGIFQQRIASGTTTTTVVTFSSTVARAGIAVFRIQNNKSDTPHHVNSSPGNETSSVSTTLNGLAGGVAVAGFVGNDNARVTWTGITERYDEGPESLSGMSGGDWTFASDETGRSISAAGASDSRALVAASWR